MATAIKSTKEVEVVTMVNKPVVTLELDMLEARVLQTILWNVGGLGKNRDAAMSVLDSLDKSIGDLFTFLPNESTQGFLVSKGSSVVLTLTTFPEEALK